jgi:hypothetical protein
MHLKYYWGYAFAGKLFWLVVGLQVVWCDLCVNDPFDCIMQVATSIVENFWLKLPTLECPLYEDWRENFVSWSSLLEIQCLLASYLFCGKPQFDDLIDFIRVIVEGFLLWFADLYQLHFPLFGIIFVIQTQTKSSLTLSLRECWNIGSYTRFRVS